MNNHDITLNIHYTLPRELEEQLFSAFSEMNGSEKGITISCEPGGFQLYDNSDDPMSDIEWNEWLNEFCRRAEEILGYKIGNAEDGYEMKIYE
ncbi:MAG: hypothetical protein IJ368_10265 [Oscillospiraceae bacterium]|nr:hypothetical protein [Oscillospiraceae bacterium]